MRGGIGAFPMTSIGGNWLAKGDGLSLGPPRVGLLAEACTIRSGIPRMTLEAHRRGNPRRHERRSKKATVTRSDCPPFSHTSITTECSAYTHSAWRKDGAPSEVM